MRIAVTGATGFIGRQLVPHLQDAGHEVVALVRSLSGAEEALGPKAELRAYDPLDAVDLRDALVGVEGIVNLGGVNIFAARWTTPVKKVLRDSRVLPTRAFAEALAPVPLAERPKVMVSASAIGIYGSREPGVPCREDEHDATNFASPDVLAALCKEWESAARRLEPLGVRVVRPRIGVVLGPGGGALERMEPFARKRISVKIGNGRQMVSWIHIRDLLAVLTLGLEADDLKGAVNATAPTPVSNAGLAKALARALRKRVLAPGLPAPAAKLMFGPGRAGVLLGGQDVRPYVLQERGFRFAFPTIDEALADLYPSPVVAH